MQSVLKGSRVGMRVARAAGINCSMQSFGPKAVRSAAQSRPFSGSSFVNRPTVFPKMSITQSSKSNPFRTFGSGGGAGGRGGSGGGGGGGGGEGGLWGAYMALLRRNPLSTKAVTAAVLNGLGDIFAQTFYGDGAAFDYKRFAIFTFLGLGLIGPALHFWYGALSKMVTATGTTGALIRLALDQLAFAPFFLSAIVGSIMALEGQAAEVPAKLKADLFTIVKSNWTLWVPFQFLNFRFVPVNLQVLAANTVALAWNTYMSWVSHKVAA